MTNYRREGKCSGKPHGRVWTRCFVGGEISDLDPANESHGARTVESPIKSTR